LVNNTIVPEKKPYRESVSRIRELSKQFARVSYELIPRDINVADEVAARSLDSVVGTAEWMALLGEQITQSRDSHHRGRPNSRRRVIKRRKKQILKFKSRKYRSDYYE
jgi:hypothetical protein